MDGSRFHVLAVDDRPDNLTILEALLFESFPVCQVQRALSGQEGLDIAFARTPDVVLLDVLMPGMDGFEVCRQLKADERTMETPVVFVTAIKDDAASRVRALDAGADGFLTKPVDQSELTAQVRAMLKIRTAALECQDVQRRLHAMVQERTAQLEESHDHTKQLLADVLEAQSISHIASFERDATTDEFVWTPEMKVLLGTPDLECVRKGEGVARFVHPDDVHSVVEWLRSEEGYSREPNHVFRLVRPDGEIRHVELRLNEGSDASGIPARSRGTLQDVTESKVKDERLRNSERLFRDFIDASRDLIFLKDDHFRHIFANRTLSEYFGRSSEEVIGRVDFDLMPQTTANACRASDQSAVEENTEFVSEEIVKGRVYESVKFPVTLLDGHIGVGGILRDITERKKSEARLLYIGYHDHLTGLHNRRYFEEEIARLDVEVRQPLSVVVVDINGVKFVNDAFGRAAGDRMIVATAHCIQSCCRRNDVLARTGGDEFMVLLPSTDAEAARHIMDRIQSAIENAGPAAAAGEDPDGVTISIAMGCGTKSQLETSFALVMKSAEDDMYQSKLLDRKSLHNRLISSIRATMLEKSQETEAHSERLIDLSRRMGVLLQLTAKELRELQLLSVLHDIGKVGIPEKILNKPDKLDKEEWTIMQQHSEMGYRIAMASPELVSIAELILTHHERWDGKGYPQRLVGEATPLLSRILAVVDSYDAMASDRPYRKCMPKERIVEEIRLNVGTQFDPNLARLFLEQVLPTIP